ncbi:MAG: aspartate aminotransferase family protein [Proteobacteria bacterium]|nr:aspartate aminotransferase family protein [Pseudomonadota bacterium]
MSAAPALPLPPPLLDNLGAAQLPVTLVEGSGARVYDDTGRGYWDFYGGHAVTILGQGHPRWIAAIADQAAKLSFCTTMTPTPIRTKAAQSLCDFTGMDVAFFVNSGAEANEAALKLARKLTGRPVIIAMEKGFHGRTMGALGATWKYREQHAPAHGDVRFVPFGDLEALQAALGPDVAAVITEPVQGIAGIVEAPPGYLAAVESAVRTAGAMLICDEVQSGIGRAGWPLLCMREGVRPDIVTVGKGLGGGFPVAATLMTEAVAASASPGEHGTTFGGAPLGCAAVEATLRILRDENLVSRAGRLGSLLKIALGGLDGVEVVRGSGVWLGLVLDRPAKPVQMALLERGFMVGTSGDPKVLRLCPPAVLPESAVGALSAALGAVLEAE